MHLGNGAITPECVALTAGLAAAGLATGAAALRTGNFTRQRLARAVGLGCVVFAAQVINVPVAGGYSAHLVGGALLASLLGPGLAVWTMTAVLLLQALLLGDGGVAALGANVLNMALLPAALVAAVNRMMPVADASPSSIVVRGWIAGLATPLAAGLIVVETALFRSSAELSGWASFAATMIGTHAWIGVFEGVLTSALLAAIVPLALRAEARPAWRMAVAGGIAVMLLAALVLPVSSGLPDGYQAAAIQSGFEWLLRP